MNKPYSQSEITRIKHLQRQLNREEFELLNREVVYVKGCSGSYWIYNDLYWLYERKSGVRGVRINGVNYDYSDHFMAANREPEIHDFFMNSKYYANILESKPKRGKVTIMGADEWDKNFVVVN